MNKQSHMNGRDGPCVASMRSAFVQPGSSIHYFVVEFDPKDLKWEAFRGEVLGPTDPADAPKGSLRAAIYASWKQLGLKSTPTIGENGVHASASPLEGGEHFLPLSPQAVEFAAFFNSSSSV